jgi:uncharacterized SAM-binding protein YcdF (DUF218 family)
MYFILSKVLAFLLFPLSYVFVLLLIAIFSKSTRNKKRYLLWGVGVLYIFSNSLLLNLVAKAWDVAPGKLDAGKTYNAAIILGGFSSEAKKGEGMFNTASDRFIQGVILQRTGRVKDLLISGGNGNLSFSTFREATWVKLQLQAVKVPDSCILIEANSRNTMENAAYSKTLLLKHGRPGPYILVTSAFHMRRSMMIFKKKGVDVIAYPCNYLAGTGDFSLWDLQPSADAMSKWSLYIKEGIGYVVNSISG